jgi:hypothetical protein
LGKEGGSVPGFALNTNQNNGVNVNRYNDDNDNNNVAASGSPSPELLSPPFLPLPNALYPSSKHASYLIEPFLEWDDLLQWKHLYIDCKSYKHPQHINLRGKTSETLSSLFNPRKKLCVV